VHISDNVEVFTGERHHSWRLCMTSCTQSDRHTDTHNEGQIDQSHNRLQCSLRFIGEYN